MDSRSERPDSTQGAPEHDVLRRANRRMYVGVAAVVMALPAPVLGGVFFGQEGFVMGCGFQLVLVALAMATYGGFRKL